MNGASYSSWMAAGEVPDRDDDEPGHWKDDPTMARGRRRSLALQWMRQGQGIRTGVCGLHKLSADELIALAQMIEAYAMRTGNAAFDAAIGR